MKIIKFFKNNYGTLDKNKFVSLMKEVNNSLPEEYINYLISYNGGTVSPACFDISEKEGATIVSAFYGLHNGPNFNRLDKVNETFKDRIANNYFTIASDTTGNQICICLDGKDKDAIYFWDHELEGSTDCLIKISNSLGKFWDLLYEFELKTDEISDLLASKDENQWKKLISSYDIESQDENGRSLIERAVIKNNLVGVKILVASGAKLNDSVAIARKNYKFFPEFKTLCTFLDNVVVKR